ncbi:MAG TPA: CDC27 family protein [Polyangiaceae bacterium]|nr:CDC27 family protein [Polyangiaceae bacterium]
MGYLGYYAAWLALSYLIRQPWLLAGLVVLWLLRGWLPAPGALFGALSRAGRLREQVRVNRANITARRDLATIYIDVLRPGRAIPLLEEGLALAPDDAELQYLHGLALHRAGRHEQALPPLLSAIERDQRLRHGAPYFVAGEVLVALKRWEDAADAFERYQDFNGSDVAAHTWLARAYAGGGDAAAARKWLLAGLHTWHGLSGSLKRRQFGAYLKAQWARVTVLKAPGAIVVAALLGAGLVAGAVAAYPLALQLWRPKSDLLARARAASKACGTQRTGAFEGTYRIVDDSAQAAEADSESLPIEITRDRIVLGGMSYCLSKVLEQKPQSLHAEAILRGREDSEPFNLETEYLGVSSDELGAALLYDVRLDRGSELVKMRVAPIARPLSASSFKLRRQP